MPKYIEEQLHYIEEQLSQQTATLEKLRRFVEKHGQGLADNDLICGDTIFLTDAARAGHHFGKTGWVRNQSSLREVGKVKYDWDRTIDGVKLRIMDAEKLETLHRVEVPEKVFPLMLEENNG